MHNIGSVLQESNWGPQAATGATGELGEFEGEMLGELVGEGEAGFEGGFELEGEAGEFAGELLGETGAFNEMHEYELAAELLAVTNEQELDQFLGKVFRSAARAAGNFARSQAGRALGGILKNVARQALPVVGTALGNFVLPGVGGAVGGKLASMAGRALGLELEGLSAEDREFEVARRVVRLSAASARQLAAAPQDITPMIAARRAFVSAARQVAPGVMNAMRDVATGAINSAVTAAGQSFGSAVGQAVAGGFGAAPTGCPNCGGRRALVRRSRDGRGLVIYVRLR